MSLRRCDRYLLRQMVGPFFLALAGLTLFILLNLILRLSELMVDRGIDVAQLLKLLIFWMPELIAWAIPMSALFAVFLGLGRMEHDREIMALESIGVSLRRVLLPLLIAAVGLSFVTFAVYNWAMPASKNAAQRTYREILFTQSVPRISANTFFTGANDQYFYVRQYDADDGSVHDVLIYDVSGRLFPQAESQITMVTADSGIWTGDNWDLSDGRMYGFNREGELVYSGTFEELSIPVTQTADQIWSQSKSTSEMSIRELLARIERARTSGISINESIVELHQRFALPLSALLFVLVGGVVSLMFGSRNRSTGIIIGLLIIGLYQGTYFWMQALGRRGAMNPAMAAWIPNLLFGLIGLLLYLRVDKLASRDMWNRLRNRLPFLTSLLLLSIFSLPSMGQDVPLHLECDDLFISTDRTEVIAQGSVHAKLDDADLQADSFYLKQDDDGQWRLEAAGNVSLDFGEFDLTGDRIAADVIISQEGARTQSLEATEFHGQSEFTNSSGEAHTLYFHGESGQLVFDEAGELDLVEILNGEITTCNCCDRPFQEQPYTLRANRLLYYPNRMIVAFGLTGRISGVSMLWLPVYVQPLEDTLESPLFPAFGTSALRGWFLKWNVPFYLSESLYGSVLFDYYSKFNELGLGLVTRYTFAGHEGRVRIYNFPAKIGDSVFEFSAQHDLPAGETWRGEGSFDLRVVGSTTELDYGAQAQGSSDDWTIRVSATRAIEVENTDDEDPDNDETTITERIPEITLSRNAWTLGGVAIRPSIDVGRYREQFEEDPVTEALRLSGALSLSSGVHTLLGVDLTPRLIVRATAYEGDSIGQSSGSLQATVDARWHDVSANYNLILVRGESPFDFDAEVATHHISWDITRSGWGTLNIKGGIALDSGLLDPIRGQLTWTDWADWTFSADYNVPDIALTSLLLAGNWSADTFTIAWSIPYLPTESRFGKLTLSGEAPGEQIGLDIDAALDQGVLTVTSDLAGNLSIDPFTLKGNVTFSNLTFSSLALTSEYTSPHGWGAKVTWTYSGGALSLDAVRYGVFWDVGDCLRIGIDREASEIWVYASILAFPEAILRYAPESASIQVGD
ncbi:LptF/LptG family permease [Candidatus Bipolaricaulota bacterium]|nr:LptF/LptG family permease [Candidatus Bipolaricaulota bacterium]